MKYLLLRREGCEDIVEGELLPHLPRSLALDDRDGPFGRRGSHDGQGAVLFLFFFEGFLIKRIWFGGRGGRRVDGADDEQKNSEEE